MIIHLMLASVHTQEYKKFIERNFFDKQHKIIIYSQNNPHNISLKEEENTILIKSKKELIKFYLLNKDLKKSKKIIIHGFYWPYLAFYYIFNMLTLKKSSWVIWGGDLYSYRKRKANTFLKKIYYKIEDFVKGHMDSYITHIEGDYELAKKWYGATGKYYSCFMYISNTYKEIKSESIFKNCICIQVGNSGYSSNNHFEILDKLERYKDRNIRVFCPLSYGEKLWANKVIEYGKNIFGEKFIPITDFMKFEDYMEFIAKIDIAIFAHDRQQAVGNITSLLGMEKTVYLKKEVTTYDMLKDLGVKVGDFSELNNLDLFSIEDRKKNKKIIKERFSEKRLLEDLKEIFDN